jgi:hypothetical protein
VITLSPEQISKLTARLGREIEAWLRTGAVEQHYSAPALAEVLQVSERTIWVWIDLYESSSGKEGIGPVVKLSHKTVRIPASSVHRMLRSRTVDAAALAGTDGKEAA